jgi:hypothetical protein
MRRELPIAFVLIATGIALWAGKNGELNRLKRWLNPAGEFFPAAAGQSPETASEFSLASGRSIVAPTENPAGSPTIPATTKPLISLQSGVKDPSSESIQFLQMLGSELRDAAAFKLDLVAELNWIRSELLIAGKYAQLGKGTGQSRIDLQIGTGNEARILSKICDGRFLYSLTQSHGQKKLEFIDLRRIQETRDAAGLSQANNPINWIATGGLASFLENAAAAFQFSEPHYFDRDGQQHLQMDGTWIQSALVDLLKGSIPSHHLTPNIEWNELPRHIPHQVRITFIKHPSLGWLPQQIHFLRFSSRQDQSASTTAEAASLSSLAKITFSSPHPIDVDSKDFLQLNAEEVETIDNTPLYISQVKRFEMHRQAETQVESGLIIR